ncbi:hypothetical protein PM082_010425 [Marasmius tenuissimus]|nr:hypothetical protein PM082_010425 [Marasmius tenuissimus]
MKSGINSGNRDPTDSDLDQDQPLLNAVKNKNAKQKRAAKRNERAASPTRKTSAKGARPKASAAKPSKSSRLKTPPPAAAPEILSTPPPTRNRKVQLSPMHTPLSHKGLHMSPSTSLAHYKMHLDPPPVAPHGSNDDELFADFLHTPLRGPVTPKRIGGLDESPFRASFISPFRTPGSRLIIDEHDPRALLDAELNRLGAEQSDSPPTSGLFGKQRELLYESPNPIDASPGKWGSWSRQW